MKRTKFENYNEFVDKFKPKKTTDDCYTPKAVYDCILDYVSNKCDIKGRKVVRPFFPGGDYEKYEYPPDCIVIDNPPFSIISQICRFYIDNNINFFLFAPHLTLFSVNLDYTRLVVGAPIIYENGAILKTSFVSNLFEDIAVMSDCDLYIALKQIISKKNHPKYKYPPNVLTVSNIQWCIERGISMKFMKDEIYKISALNSQKKYKKAIYGSGFLLSEKAALEKAALEKAASEKAALEKAASENDNVIIWELSNKEVDIINKLNKNETK